MRTRWFATHDESSLRRSRGAGRLALVGVVALLGVGCFGGVEESTPEMPTDPESDANVAPSAKERRKLFDGETLAGWRGYRMDGVPAGWSVADGKIHFAPPEEGERADLMTEEQFESFELTFEWAVTEGANSGVFFHVSEDHDRSYETGPEYQILDDANHRDGEKPITSAGSNYALHPPNAALARPVGEFNESRIIVAGDRVVHWMNGEKLLEYTLWDDDWKQRVADSKFASMPAYGLEKTGHIVLQDHGNELWFRNIRIRPLD